MWCRDFEFVACKPPVGTSVNSDHAGRHGDQLGDFHGHPVTNRRFEPLTRLATLATLSPKGARAAIR